MRIEIRGRNFQLTPPLRAHIERRVKFAMVRFGPRIKRLVVQLADVNGPRGGKDKRCRIAVNLLGLKSVMVEELDTDPHAAIDRAADLAGRCVARRLAQNWAFQDGRKAHKVIQRKETRR